MKDLGVTPMAWAPLAEGGHNIWNHPVLSEIAQKYGKSVAQIALRFNVQRGVIVIPKTVHVNRMSECQRQHENVGFRRKGMSFFAGQYTSVYRLNHHITCRLEARQALIYQFVLGLTGENGKYNYLKAVHVYPPSFDISSSAKYCKIESALTYIMSVHYLLEGAILTEW